MSSPLSYDGNRGHIKSLFKVELVKEARKDSISFWKQGEWVKGVEKGNSPLEGTSTLATLIPSPCSVRLVAFLL
jgi:hypothetical protein